MLTYCHAPAHSCSRAIPCEDRALTIRGFPRPAPCREGCKVFLEYRFCSPGRHSETSAILWIQNAISSHQKNIFIKENLWILWVLREKKISEWEENIFHTESTEPTELFLRNEQNICYHTGIRIHRTCRRLRRDGWRDGERMTKTLNYKTEGWQNTLNAPSVHIISLYLTLSRSILQGAGFKHYICKRKNGTDPPHPSHKGREWLLLTK